MEVSVLICNRVKGSYLVPTPGSQHRHDPPILLCRGEPQLPCPRRHQLPGACPPRPPHIYYKWHVTCDMCVMCDLFSCFLTCTASISKLIFLSSQLLLGNSWLSLNTVSLSEAFVAPALPLPLLDLFFFLCFGSDWDGVLELAFILAVLTSPRTPARPD